MSVTTSERLNSDKLQACLAAVAPGAAFTSDGGLLESADAKTITPVGATDDQLTQAIATAAGQYVDYAAVAAQARTGLGQMIDNKAAFGAQLQADIATLTNAGGWSKVAAADQDAIMARVLNGFGTVLQAIADHVTVTGAA